MNIKNIILFICMLNGLSLSLLVTASESGNKSEVKIPFFQEKVATTVGAVTGMLVPTYNPWAHRYQYFLRYAVCKGAIGGSLGFALAYSMRLASGREVLTYTRRAKE
jgi:hypothetical protein